MIRACVVSVLALAAVAGTASATVIQARLDSITPRRDMSVSSNGGSSSQTLRSGVNNFTVLGGDPSLLAPAFTGFCIDLNQTIQVGNSYTFTASPLEAAPVPGGGMGSVKANQLRELWGRYQLLTTTGSSTNAAAFQIAVWEIVFDSGLDLASGAVQVGGHSATLTLAQGWLNSLNGDVTKYAGNVYALTSASGQDMIVPTPGSLALLGLAGLAIARRRRA